MTHTSYEKKNMLSRAGIETTSPLMLVGRDNRCTIEATTLATWPLIDSIPARDNMNFFSCEVCVESHLTVADCEMLFVLRLSWLRNTSVTYCKTIGIYNY